MSGPSAVRRDADIRDSFGFLAPNQPYEIGVDCNPTPDTCTIHQVAALLA